MDSWFGLRGLWGRAAAETRRGKEKREEFRYPKKTQDEVQVYKRLLAATQASADWVWLLWYVGRSAASESVLEHGAGEISGLKISSFKLQVLL
jgi:hypothetical protein